MLLRHRPSVPAARWSRSAATAASRSGQRAQAGGREPIGGAAAKQDGVVVDGAEPRAQPGTPARGGTRGSPGPRWRGRLPRRRSPATRGRWCSRRGGVQAVIHDVAQQQVAELVDDVGLARRDDEPPTDERGQRSVGVERDPSRSWTAWLGNSWPITDAGSRVPRSPSSSASTPAASTASIVGTFTCSRSAVTIHAPSRATSMPSSMSIVRNCSMKSGLPTGALDPLDSCAERRVAERRGDDLIRRRVVEGLQLDRSRHRWRRRRRRRWRRSGRRPPRQSAPRRRRRYRLRTGVPS